MSNDVKILKLITGEEVITRITEGDTGFIILDKPMVLQSVSNQQGKMTMVLIPWMRGAKNLAETEKVTISTEYILVEDDPIEEIEKDYLSIITGLTL
mgnify:CR=1 FL=1